MTLRDRGSAPLPAGVAPAELTVPGGGPDAPPVDLCALLVDARGCARGQGDFVHPDAAVHASGAIRLHAGPADGARGAGDGAVVGTLAVDLAAVEPAVDAVLVVARGASGPDGRLPPTRLRVHAGGRDAVVYDRAAADGESAAVLGAFRRDGGDWRFHVVGQGYRTGLAGLAAAHGLRRDALPAMPVPEPPARTPYAETPPADPPVLAAAPGRRALPARVGPPEPVTLTAAFPAVALAAQGGTSGALAVTLDRTSTAAGEPHAPGGPAGASLGALYELTDGRKGVVQALGGALGALDRPPYVALRTPLDAGPGGRRGPGGDVSAYGRGPSPDDAAGAGETITLNLDHSMRFRRVLFFATVRHGAGSLAGLRPTAVLHPEHGAPIGVPVEECDLDAQVCALARLSYEREGLTVRREARWIGRRRGVSPQRTIDYAYGWGLTWAPRRV